MVPRDALVKLVIGLAAPDISRPRARRTRRTVPQAGTLEPFSAPMVAARRGGNWSENWSGLKTGLV
jgi:hypothetical protein